MSNQLGSPQDLSTIGRIAKQIRKGKYDDHTETVKYPAPEFLRKNRTVDGVIHSVNVSLLRDEIKRCIDKGWMGSAMMLFGEFCHDLLYYIRSKGHIEITIDHVTFIVEKRGKDVMRSFSEFMILLGVETAFPAIQDLMKLCTISKNVSEKVHLRTLLVMFADLPSLFIAWAPVKITRLLGSGGQRTIFEIKTRKNEYYALRPDTRDKELERMFVCLEALDASHLFHIFEALDYEDGAGRCHLFMPVMMELDTFFTAERLRTDIGSALALVHHTALQLGAMAKEDLVHRDVKPANILVYSDRSSPKDKTVDLSGRPFFFLTDFGWSCERGSDSNGAVGGTKQYRDPYMYVIPPHPKHDIWCMGLAFLFLINRATENSSRATMVRRIKVWQENILTDKTEGAEFTVQDFTKWMFQWERMALGSPMEDTRRFRVGNEAFTHDFRDMERGCLDLRWEKRWDSEYVLKWTHLMAEKYKVKHVTQNFSFKKSAEAFNQQRQEF